MGSRPASARVTFFRGDDGDWAGWRVGGLAGGCTEHESYGDMVGRRHEAWQGGGVRRLGGLFTWMDRMDRMTRVTGVWVPAFAGMTGGAG